MSGCADLAFDLTLENPCRQLVDFADALVEPGGYLPPGAAEAISVVCHGSEKLLEGLVLAGSATNGISV